MTILNLNLLALILELSSLLIWASGEINIQMFKNKQTYLECTQVYVLINL